MAKTDPASDTEARLEALRPPLLAALEAAVQALTDIRKGRKAPAVLIMFDKQNPDNIVGYRLGLVDLQQAKVGADLGAALD